MKRLLLVAMLAAGASPLAGQSEEAEVMAVVSRLFDGMHILGRLATAWTPYAFYLGGGLSHCGVNAFQLFNGKDGWSIIRITDTRRREGCEEAAG